MIVPTTLAVMGILSSCPRVMTMQCWKSQIPPPLSTRLRAVCSLFVFWFCADQKEKKYDSAKFPSKIKTQSQVKSQHCTFSLKSPKFQEYQNNYPKLQNHSKIDENLWKTHKKSKKHIKSKEKRPKANASSHNACRFGYPFFLSPSDDDAMLEIPNTTPSVHQTFRYCCVVFVVFFVPPKREKKHDSTKLPRK